MANPKISYQIKVGFLILVGLLIAAIAIFSVGKQDEIWQKKYRLKICFSRVNGLQKGAPVRLAGLRVGAVEDIYFSDDSTHRLEVIIKVNKSVQSRIRKNSLAKIGTLGLLGDKTIEIEPGSSDQPVLEDGQYLTGKDTYDMEQMISEGGEIFDNLKKTSESAKNIAYKIDEGVGALGMIINDPEMYFDLDTLLYLTTQLTNKINSGKGTLALLFNDPGAYNNLKDFLKSATVLVDSIKSGQGSLGKMVRDPELYNELNDLVLKLNTISKEIESGGGNINKLIYDKELYDNLKLLTKRIDELVEDIKKNPKKYVNFKLF